jgi:hypothetical protein
MVERRKPVGGVEAGGAPAGSPPEVESSILFSLIAPSDVSNGCGVWCC